MSNRTLAAVVAMKPYPDYAAWWPMGGDFMAFMAAAIGEQWRAVVGEEGDLALVQQTVAHYSDVVYQRAARPSLVADFLHRHALGAFQSGEFDALSYAFFNHAYTTLAARIDDETELRAARHAFTQQVGRRFYQQVHAHLALELPAQVATAEEFATLQAALHQVGNFLKTQGYLRDHFAFRFDVALNHAGRQITQCATEVVAMLQANQPVYALYEMGYPAILPSAVYLYHTMGEAQHHSSRTIEELFGRMGYRASETADFDPTGYPSELVVELWEIRGE